MHDILVKAKAIVHYTHFLKSLRKVSKLYNVSKSSLQRWVKQSKYASCIKPHRCSKKIKTELQICIRNSLKDNPFLTMRGLTDICLQQCNVKRSSRTFGRYVKSLGFTIKNASRVIDKKHDNENIKAFCETYNSALSTNLICIDECGFYIGDHPKRGYSKKGTKLKIESQRCVRRSKFTLIMAVSSQGIEHYEIMDHNCKKTDFISFIERLDVIEGSTILMDNVAFHHSKDTIRALNNKKLQPLFIYSHLEQTALRTSLGL